MWIFFFFFWSRIALKSAALSQGKKSARPYVKLYGCILANFVDLRCWSHLIYSQFMRSQPVWCRHLHSPLYPVSSVMNQSSMLRMSPGGQWSRHDRWGWDGSGGVWRWLGNGMWCGVLTAPVHPVIIQRCRDHWPTLWQVFYAFCRLQFLQFEATCGKFEELSLKNDSCDSCSIEIKLGTYVKLFGWGTSMKHPSTRFLSSLNMWSFYSGTAGFSALCVGSFSKKEKLTGMYMYLGLSLGNTFCCVCRSI